MEIQKIMSGKGKVQILCAGFRFQKNRGPQGPLDTTYFTCTEPDCKATLNTTGKLEGKLTLKKHNIEQHNHRADESKNIVAASLSEFRERVKSNPECKPKSVFDEITTNALESVSTPNKFDLAKKLPTYKQGKHKQFLFLSMDIIFANNN